jgi:cell division protease FtsH
MDQAHDEAYAILTENRDILDRLAASLLEHETLNQREIAEIFADVRKRDFREVWLSKESRPVQYLPPVETENERRQREELEAKARHDHDATDAERQAQEEANDARRNQPLDAQHPHVHTGGEQEFTGNGQPPHDGHTGTPRHGA